MADPRCHLLLTFLINCNLILATYTLGAAALSFNYNFAIPADRAQLKLINASYAGVDQIILTDEVSNLTGRVAHPQPVRLWDDRSGRQASFTTTFHFAIHASSNVSRGDGMAFFIGPFPAATPPPRSDGGLLGLFSNPNTTGDDADSLRPPHTMAVEFDTCWNDGWDPSDGGGDHIGIDVNGIRSNWTRNLPPLSLNGTMWANITYDAESKVMKVTLRTIRTDSTSTTYELSAKMDLKDEAGLVQDAAVGFSAATGLLSESHHLLAWSFHSTDPSRSETKMWVIFLFVAAILLTGLVAALLYITVMHRRRRCLHGKVLQVARKFSYSELVAATENFSVDRKVGNGCFGDVYRGQLPDDLGEVAVKKMRQPTPKRNRKKYVQEQIERNRKNYVHEIQTLCQLRHKNLLRLIGWCDDGGRLLLVYELELNGSVSDHLHGGKTPLTWPERYNVLLGIASAIAYLHTGAYDSAKRYVLHRDIKPSNVMLGEGFHAKLGDFGLVRQVTRHGGGTPRTTVIGSMDYMDPKYIETGSLSSASDVYSFGVLLLEVATAVKPSVPRGALPGCGHRNSLVSAVRECHGRNAILDIVDERVRCELEQCGWQMERVMVTGLMCVKTEREDRPSIKDVIDLLSNGEQSCTPRT